MARDNMSSYNRSLLSRRFRYASRPNYNPTPEQEEHLNCVHNKIRTGFYKLQEHPCPSCNSDKYEVIGEVDRHGLPCSTTICTSCGLLMTNPCFRPEDYSDFYFHHYRNIYKDIQTNSNGQELSEDYETIAHNRPRVVDQYTLLQKNLIMDNKTKVLELGCGKGELLYRLSKDGCECIGTDYDEKVIAFGQAHGLQLLKGDLNDIEEGNFDLVIMSHSLEHMPNPTKVIYDIARKMSDAGKLFINVPNVLDTFIGTYSDLMNIVQFVHLFNFTPQSLNNLMTNCNFNHIVTESNSDNREILALFEKRSPSHAEIMPEYTELSRALRRHEYSRWVQPHYLYEKILHYSYPYRHKLGLSNLKNRFTNKLW